MFDVIVAQQKAGTREVATLESIKKLTYGGWMSGSGMAPDTAITSGRYADTPFKGFGLKTKLPSRNIRLSIHLHTDQQEDIAVWEKGILKNSG